MVLNKHQISKNAAHGEYNAAHGEYNAAHENEMKLKLKLFLYCYNYIKDSFIYLFLDFSFAKSWNGTFCYKKAVALKTLPLRHESKYFDKLVEI